MTMDISIVPVAITPTTTLQNFMRRAAIAVSFSIAEERADHSKVIEKLGVQFGRIDRHASELFCQLTAMPLGRTTGRVLHCVQELRMKRRVWRRRS